METQTIWNDTVLQKEKYYTKTSSTRGNNDMRKNGGKELINVDTSSLQMPVLKTLFNTSIFNKPKDDRISGERLQNPRSDIQEGMPGNEYDEEDYYDEDDDDEDVPTSGDANSRYKSSYIPPASNVDLTNNNVLSKIGEPTVRNNPFTSSTATSPVKQKVNSSAEPNANSYSADPTGGSYSADPTGGSSSSDPTGGSYPSPLNKDTTFDSSETYEDLIRAWKKRADEFREYNPIGVIIIIIMFIYNKLFVELFGSQFQQSFYQPLMRNYFMFIKLVISIFVTYNLFYLYFYRFEDGEYMLFLPINYIWGFKLGAFLVDWIPLLYNGFLATRDLIIFSMNQAEKRGYVNRFSKYKIIFVFLFLVSINFTTVWMEVFYDGFMNALSLNNDKFANNVLVVVILYSIYCFVLGLIQYADVFQTTMVLVAIYIIAFLMLILISVYWVALPVSIICIIVFMATVFPWMIFRSPFQFDVFHKINEFCEKPPEFPPDKLSQMFDMATGLVGNAGGLMTKLENSNIGDMGKLSNELGLGSVVGSDALGAFGGLGGLGGLGMKGGDKNAPDEDSCNDFTDGDCKPPDDWFSKGSFGSGSKKLWQYSKILLHFLYKRLFYVTFAILFTMHLIMYYQKIDSDHSHFRNILLAICSVFICMFTLFMVYPDTLTKHIGLFVYLFYVIIFIVVVVIWFKLLYDYLYMLSKYGSSYFGVDVPENTNT
jgi:hypothetical protein